MNPRIQRNGQASGVAYNSEIISERNRHGDPHRNNHPLETANTRILHLRASIGSHGLRAALISPYGRIGPLSVDRSHQHPHHNTIPISCDLCASTCLMRAGNCHTEDSMFSKKNPKPPNPTRTGALVQIGNKSFHDDRHLDQSDAGQSCGRSPLQCQRERGSE